MDIWTDPWIPWNPNFKAAPFNDLVPIQPLSVSCLFSDCGVWNVSLLNSLFNTNTVSNILRLH